MYFVTREFKFDSAHYLNGYHGDCGNLHGHTWRVAVTVAGEQLDELGMLVDFKEIKALVTTGLIERLDHKLLNDVIPFNPTAENLANFIYHHLSGILAVTGKPVGIYRIRIWENFPECYVDYYGED